MALEAAATKLLHAAQQPGELAGVAGCLSSGPYHPPASCFHGVIICFGAAGIRTTFWVAVDGIGSSGGRNGAMLHSVGHS